LRIDDLDTPRNIPGSVSAILSCLQAFGLQWDGEIYYQSRRLEAYRQALDYLRAADLVYACACSRGQLNLLSAAVYPGYCRDKRLASFGNALRVKTGPLEIGCRDALQGAISENLAARRGDFIIKRKDGVIAYQLAVVVDDHAQQVSRVVRGGDLLDSTPKQLYLQNLLDYPHPEYMHVPVIVDANGEKLSKQTRAAAADYRAPGPVLFQLLVLLRQNPPPQLHSAPVAEQLEWAVANWRPQNLKKLSTIPEIDA
jgi:glutamyl-Q tRNA(Asp) synthetase